MHMLCGDVINETIRHCDITFETMEQVFQSKAVKSINCQCHGTEFGLLRWADYVINTLQCNYTVLPPTG